MGAGLCTDPPDRVSSKIRMIMIIAIKKIITTIINSKHNDHSSNTTILTTTKPKIFTQYHITCTLLCIHIIHQQIIHNHTHPSRYGRKT